MTNKTVRNLLKALPAFAMAASFVSVSSFAGEFTVHQGKRYRATLALNSVEQLADNALIARRFRAMGFSRVRVSGSGATRRVEERLARQGYQRDHASSDYCGCRIVTTSPGRSWSNFLTHSHRADIILMPARRSWLVVSYRQHS